MATGLVGRGTKKIVNSLTKSFSKLVVQVSMAERVTKKLDNSLNNVFNRSRINSINESNILLKNLDKMIKKTRTLEELKKIGDLRTKEGRNTRSMIGAGPYAALQEKTKIYRQNKPISLPTIKQGTLAGNFQKFIIDINNISKMMKGSTKEGRELRGKVGEKTYKATQDIYKPIRDAMKGVDFTKFLGRIPKLLTKSFGRVKPLISVMSNAVGAFMSKLSASLPLLGIITASVAVIGASFKKMYKINIGGMQTMVGKIGGVYKSNMGRLNVQIIKMFRKLDPIIRPISDLIGGAFTSAIDGVFWIIGKIVDGFGWLIDGFKEGLIVFKKLQVGMGETYISIIDGVMGVINTIMGIFGLGGSDFVVGLKLYRDALSLTTEQIKKELDMLQNDKLNRATNEQFNSGYSSQEFKEVKNYNITFNTGATQMQEDDYQVFARRFMDAIT